MKSKSPVESAGTIPNELLGSMPRAVKLSPAGYALVAIAALLLAGSVAMLAGLSIVRGRDQALRRELANSGIDAPARIVANGITRDDNKLRFAVYRFVADGREYAGRVTLRRSDRRPAKAGDRIDIRYLPGRPEKNAVVGYEPKGPPVVAIVLAPVGLLAGGIAILFAVRRQHVLLAEGRPVRAQVVGIKRLHGDKNRGYRVEYEFRLLSGAITRVKLDARRKPEENAPVTLVYDRDRPERSSVYPMSLVRATRP